MALDHTHRSPIRLSGFWVIGILTAGVLLSWPILVDTEHDLRADVLQQAQFAAQALNLERVKLLVQATANQESPEYQRLKKQLLTARAVFPKCQRLYLMGRRFEASSATATSTTGTIFCMVDGVLSNSLDQARLGPPCDKALSAACLHVFETRTAVLEGPVRDRSGTRVSALAPVINPRDGSVLAVMGMDVDACLWNAWLAHAALPVIAIMLVFAVLLLAGRVLLAPRARMTGETPEWMWRIEPALAAAIGLVLTISATLFVHMREKHDRNQAFVQLALGRTEAILETLRTLRSTELESLAQFYDHDPSISPEEYRTSFAYLTKNSAVQAWEWAPCVTAADKARFEADARAVGQAGFEIWQRDAEGKRVPATGRAAYFPVFQVAPLIGNERALGFDLGSEPIRRAALEEALRTGLATATEPIMLVQETERQKGMLVYRPVFVEGDSRHLRGLALAVLRMGTLLRSLSLDDATIQELFLLREGQPPELLAASREMEPASDKGLVMTRPFLGFGKTFLVTAHAGPGFLLRHPFRLRWVIALTGLGLTTTLTIILGTLLRRREDLERLVLRRTQELQQNETKLNLALHASKMGVWSINLADARRYYDKQTCYLLGIAPEKFAGTEAEFAAVAHPDDCDKVKQSLQQTIERGVPYDMEYRVIWQDGSIHYISARGNLDRDEQGRPLRISGIVWDNSTRKQSEIALRDSEARYRTLFENSVDGIVIADLETKGFKYANPAACRMFGYTEEELRTMGVSDIHPKDAQAYAVAEFEAQAQGKKSLATGLPCLRKDGTLFYADINAGAVMIGSRTCLVGFFRDITERKQSEAERDILQVQLRQSQKMESVGRLAGGVAHDFNNMLMVILGNVELCMAKLKPGDPLHDWLDAINKGATHAKEITNQLLGFARLQPIKLKILEFNAAIFDMLKWLQHLIGEHIAVNWQPGADLWLVEMDAAQVDQILTNLLVNARDAISGTGTITVSTANAVLDQSYCARHPDTTPGNYVVLSVTDTGSGMDQETLSHIFEPFFTTKKFGKGTGLGLATVYGIVKQNNGHIDIYSEPGHGTRFNIYLPRALDPSAHSPASSGPKPAVVGGSETILLVEDQDDVRRITHDLLVLLGYNVLVAESPEKAIRLVEEHSGEIHLLVTDVIMPNMNGWELSQRLSELRPSMKHLFMSGFAATVLTQQGILGKGVSFLPKPFSRDELAHKVREVLNA